MSLDAVRTQGLQALERRDYALAKSCFDQLTRRLADTAATVSITSSDWVHLALACRGLKDDAAEEAALFKALSVDSHDLMALLMRGHLFERQGRPHDAARAYQAVAMIAPPVDQVVPHLRQGLTHALRSAERYAKEHAEFVEQRLAEESMRFGPAELERFRLSLDILWGRKARHEARPLGYFVPALAPVEFFDRQLFPWLEAVEAATTVIRQEFLQVLESETGFAPYVQQDSDQPLAQWAELNHSPRWSAFHLLKEGLPVPGNAQRCPRTLEALLLAPQPVQEGRTPVALFSLLKPKTRIPPHHGISNARLLTHLPLIVPPACRFRVGNSVREWVPGQAWVFDDTIEHEAWNDSDQLRVILIFDVWHPALTDPEKTMISALARAQEAFMGPSAFNYSAG